MYAYTYAYTSLLHVLERRLQRHDLCLRADRKWQDVYYDGLF